jgi:hypothetical protein
MGALNFSNNTRLVAADKNGGRHAECRLALRFSQTGSCLLLR